MLVYSIVITYNGAQWIKTCLHSLLESTISTVIIVIDNGSTDETVNIVSNDFKDIELIACTENLGFGQANNIGIKRAIDAKADYILLLNQDAWVEETTLEKLINTHQLNPIFGILSPIHFSKSYQQIDFNFFQYISNDLQLFADIFKNENKDVYECEFVNAAIWLISKDCLNTVGLFDTLFFHYGEDRNYAQRTLHHQFKIGICPNAFAVHDRAERKGVTPNYLGLKTEIRKLLVKYCDITNENALSLMQEFLRKSIPRVFISILQFRFGKAKERYQLYQFLKLNKTNIRQSREVNKLPYYKHLKDNNIK